MAKVCIYEEKLLVVIVVVVVVIVAVVVAVVGRPLANDHSEGPASCKVSSSGTGLFQMIIQRDWPFPNDHPEGLAFSK